MARKIIVASAAGNRAQTFETNVNTWGELKGVIGSLWNSGLEAIESRGKTTLSRDEAILPEGDFNIYLVPTKNKAGAQTLTESLNDAIESAVDASSVDKEDVDAVLGVVKSTVAAFFSGVVASTGSASNSAAEAAVLAEAKRFS